MQNNHSIKPTISVIMGVYNGGALLKSAIDSILDQTYIDFEFIIIDDCSNDETESILKSYNDNRLIILRNTNNIGLTKSLNKALHISRGEYVARQDADDISHQDRLMKQILFLNNHPCCAMVGCQAILIDKNGILIGNINVATDSTTIKSQLIHSNQFVHGSVLMRRSILNSLKGYRENFRYTQDYDLWLRMIEDYKLCNLPDKLYSLRRLTTSISLKSYDRQIIFAILARVFFLERQENKLDSYDMLDAEQPEKLLFNTFPHLIPQFEQEIFDICITLAMEAQKIKNTKDELHWFKTALVINKTSYNFKHVFKLFCLPRIKPISSLYNRYIGWRFNS